MTRATEELRRLLDERGVESGYPYTLRPELHRSLDAAGIAYWVAQGLTFWNCPDGRECVAYGYQVNGEPMLTVKIVGITDPEQAIEATLGRGTCRDVRSADHTIAFECSECGCWVAYDEYWETGIYVLHETGQEHIHPHYCPNCGRRVEQ